MRHRILVRLTVVTAVLTGVSLAWAFSSGPPLTRTGAPSIAGVPAELNCTVCHSGSALNDPAGQLEILDAPDTYVPGNTYALRVRLGFAHNPLPPDPLKWGFQLTAVRADSGLGTGTFTVGPGLWIRTYAPTSTSVFRTRAYVEHDADGTHTGETGPVEWTFDWTAPASAVGTVHFFAAGNAANGDGSSSGDRIYTARDSSEADGTVAARTTSWGALKSRYRSTR
jgi:hypothetical protein